MMTTESDGATANVLLVHGGFHGAWCWEGVQRVLGERGVNASAVDLPFQGVASDLAALAAAVEAQRGPLTVCAHSYGGLLLNLSSCLVGRVERLVYVAAFMIDPRLLRANVVAGTGRPPQDGSEMSYAEARRAIYHDCDEKVAREAFARWRPTPQPVWDTPPSQGEGWVLPYATIPSTYVVCGEDRFLPPEKQRRMARHASHVVELRSGHAPFFSRPTELAEVLTRYPFTGVGEIIRS
jgi:pimeloyl-ACP methyl ester carboxylesterase